MVFIRFSSCFLLFCWIAAKTRVAVVSHVQSLFDNKTSSGFIVNAPFTRDKSLLLHDQCYVIHLEDFPHWLTMDHSMGQSQQGQEH